MMRDTDFNEGAGDLAARYAGRSVLVAGADGFLGLNAVYRLQALGAELTILTRRERPRAVDFRGRIFRGDLCDRSLVRELVRGQEIVLDFSGVSGAVQSNLDPFSALEEECSPHLNLYYACALESPSPVVVFSSSRLVYGKPERLPVDERHPLNPMSMYAVHKITIENYLRVFGRVHGLRHVIFRLTNPYGPHQAPQTRTHGIINQFIRQAIEGRPITIFGDGHQRRDYIHVGDVIDLFLRAAVNERCHGEIYNLGGDAAISIGEVARTISELAGGTPVLYQPWPRDYLAVETGDYESCLGKIMAALPPFRLLPLRTGLEHTIAFYRQQAAAGLKAFDPDHKAAARR